MVGEIWILLGSTRLHFMKGSADELLLHNKSSACGYTSRGANVTVQCCWKDFCAFPLFPIPGFSHTVLRRVAHLCTSCFLLDRVLGHFDLQSQQKTAFAEKRWWPGSDFSSIRGKLLDQQAVIMKLWSLPHHSYLGQRLTAETVQLLAQSFKDVLPGKGKQLMSWCHSWLCWNVK